MFRHMVAIMLGFILLFTVVAVAEEADKWILTQYYGGGSVGMFYSIINQTEGTVILVDGGWTANADQVREVIEANGGKVDYWFLTHYHEDHCGAFNALWPEYKDKIGTVYVTPLSWEEFEQHHSSWDTPETFQLFLEQTEDAENIIALYRGDELKIDGLKLFIFNAWNEDILQWTGDVANNCSLVFKVESENTSILFFGDVVAAGLADYLLETYGIGNIHSDYIQAGHHGWTLFSMDVYEKLNPKEIFVDADEYLLTSEDYKNAHGVLVRWCEENNIPMHDYRGTPYSLTLE